MRVFLTIAVVAAVAGVAHPAAADDVEPMTANPNGVTTKDYGPILGQDQVTTQVALLDPGTCTTLPSCNEIPLSFQKPTGYDSKLDTYLGQIDVSWETDQVGDRNVGASTNDIDIYLFAAEFKQTENPGDPCYVDPNADNPPDPPEYCTKALAHSANNGAVVPETVRVDVNSHDKYFLLINNASGANLGYSVKVTTRYFPYEKPFESSDPALGFGGGTSGSGIAGPVGGFSSPSPSYPSLSPSEGVPGAAALSPFAGIPGADSDLTNLTGVDLSSAISGRIVPKRSSGRSGPAKPVSTTTVVIWLILVPAVLLGVGGPWLMRRRPAALRF
jgi:hypothetical protein